MRIYDGSPRQDWEEVLRSVGAFADAEQLKELRSLNCEQGQGYLFSAPISVDAVDQLLRADPVW